MMRAEYDFSEMTGTEEPLRQATKDTPVTIRLDSRYRSTISNPWL